MKTTKEMIVKITKEEVAGCSNLKEDECDIEFVRFNDFKVRWGRVPNKWINFQLPDYLIGMDSVSIRECMRYLAKRILNGDASTKREEFIDEVLSERFIRKNQPKFLKRDRELTSEGRERIDTILEKLRNEGKIDADKDLIVVARGRESVKPIYISCLFKTIKMSRSVLDLDDDVLEYVILCSVRELCGQRIDYRLLDGEIRDKSIGELAIEIEGYEEQRYLFLERYC